MDPTLFHPAVRRWFSRHFTAPTAVQESAWASIAAGRNTLIAAPTGSGKTLAGFLAVIDRLVRQAVDGALDDGIRVVYVSPLRALSNDIERNLRQPLEGIAETLYELGMMAPAIRAQVRTGDTPPRERQQMLRKPPHILVTTPESLFILLSSASGRRALSGVEALLVDEIHALVGNKRGAHLNLSLERVAALAPTPPLRIGLSATVKPLTEVGQWLCAGESCEIVDLGHQRRWDLALEIPDEPLGAVLSNQAWEAVYDRLAKAIEDHRTTLIFANNRRLAERAARHLSERLGEEAVTAHHGSLSREHRLSTEQRLKQGELRAVVATASLELGIDVGHIDLVCQLGSPGSISGLLQRVGRAGHRWDRVPKGRLWPLSLDDLVECTALMDCARRGELDRIRWQPAAHDVLAQQLVSMAIEPCTVDALYQQVTAAWAYRHLPRDEFEQLLEMLSAGYAGRRGRRLPWLEWDKVNQQVRTRRHAGSVVMMNAGAIPDHFDYDVWLLPEESFIGTLNEDFAFESLPGDIFQLGNQSYRILKVEKGRVLVEDAAGAPPSIPFWFGDAPGRSDELSIAVSRLRESLGAALDEQPDVRAWAQQQYGLCASGADQLVLYLDSARQALGLIPTQQQLVIERFFDETDDYHLVIHSPYGVRLNRAWGLALRKRFCRHFNFELQAAAVDDAVILSLGATHSFPLAEILDYLSASSVRQVLTQAVLDAPVFAARWRWCVTIAMAVLRMRHGKRVPAQFQRNDAEDLMALVFPDSLACLENIAGEREVPDHPLVRQTLRDCLEESMDIAALERLLTALKAQQISVRCVDLNGPSPLANGILNAKPWAFLDDGAAEERRTLAVRQERVMDQAAAAALARPEEDAIRQVIATAQPVVNDADDLHDALNRAGFITAAEAQRWGDGQWTRWLQALQGDFRALTLKRSDGEILWLASERLGEALCLWPQASVCPTLPDWARSPTADQPREYEHCLDDLISSRLQVLGAVPGAELRQQLLLEQPPFEAALIRLQGEGTIVRLTAPALGGELWCLRHLGARIRRLSREQRRGIVQPASPRVFLRMLLERHGLAAGSELADLDGVLGLMQGWSAPANVWEESLLAARLTDFAVSDLDLALLTGGWSWRVGRKEGAALIGQSPVTLLEREWLSLVGPQSDEADAGEDYSEAARRLLTVLEQRGALFMPELREASGQLQPHLDALLRQLAGAGRVHGDSWSALRQLLRSDESKRRLERRLPAGKRQRLQGGLGRWGLLPERRWDEAALSQWCWVLLQRYGVIFRLLLERETLAPPWGQLLRTLRRLEDRGEIVGGRFVTGVSGEQFALSEAVAALKRLRDQPLEPAVRIIHSYDPLAWAAVVAGAPRLPLAPSHVLVLQGDCVSGWHVQDRWHWLQQQPPSVELPRF
ncbi:MAG: DEAD/DEAH box helicase [Wenzhouxiangellaceae bacterium]